MNIVGLFLGKKMRVGLFRQMEAEVLELERFCEAGG
jgi:hypothetical protein